MKITANIRSGSGTQAITVTTNNDSKALSIPAKTKGKGSSINGGELLLLALGTCYCNDIYREAAKRNINISRVEVFVNGEFGGEGEPGSNFTYKAEVDSDAPPEIIEDLLQYTDGIAEIHNTLRRGLEINRVK